MSVVPTKIETPRLFGERLLEHHFHLMCQMHANEQVMATLGGLRDEDRTRQHLEWNLNQWDEFGHGLWVFFCRETGKFAGRGVRRVEAAGVMENEVGYALMPSFWGRGLATEMARESARIGFEIAGYPELVAFTMPSNLASLRVIEKIGFVYEKDFEFYQLPHVLYRKHRP